MIICCTLVCLSLSCGGTWDSWKVFKVKEDKCCREKQIFIIFQVHILLNGGVHYTCIFILLNVPTVRLFVQLK